MITVTIQVRVSDERILHAYTSGFMPDDATNAARVVDRMMMRDQSFEQINGVEIVSVVSS